jgi:hypothetical protein
MKHCGLGDLNIDITKTRLLPFTLKRIVRQKGDDYENSNILPCKKYSLQKILKKKKPKSFKKLSIFQNILEPKI